MKPHRDVSAESGGGSGPPVWQLVRGLSRGGLVYQHRDGAAVHLHDEGDGFLEVATWEPTHELVLPDRAALGKIASADIEQMAETSLGRAMLMVTRVSEMAVMRSSQGRPRLWPDHELLALAREFLEYGDHWTSDHARWARKRGLERRHVLKLMRRAEAAGLITIGKSGGPRSANVYALTGLEPEQVDAKTRAAWHRKSWLELERMRGALGANWERQRPDSVDDSSET
jgi:hypothetical protein